MTGTGDFGGGPAAGEGDRDDVAAAVLAGGAGSRMGSPKADAVLAGEPLVEYPLRALRAAGLDPFVVTKADRPVGAAAEVVVEPDLPRHPLTGILAAIEHAAGRQVVVVACDMPLLPPELLRWLAGLPGGTIVPKVAGHLQPLAARYGPEAAGPIREALKGGREGPGGRIPAVMTVLAELGPRILEEDRLRRFGDPDRMFTNVNTPEELARLERELTG